MSRELSHVRRCTQWRGSAGRSAPNEFADVRPRRERPSDSVRDATVPPVQQPDDRGGSLGRCDAAQALGLVVPHRPIERRSNTSAARRSRSVPDELCRLLSGPIPPRGIVVVDGQLRSTGAPQGRTFSAGSSTKAIINAPPGESPSKPPPWPHAERRWRKTDIGEEDVDKSLHVCYLQGRQSSRHGGTECGDVSAIDAHVDRLSPIGAGITHAAIWPKDQAGCGQSADTRI